MSMTNRALVLPRRQSHSTWAFEYPGKVGREDYFFRYWTPFWDRRKQRRPPPRGSSFQFPLQSFNTVDLVVQGLLLDLHVLKFYTGMHNSTLVPNGFSYCPSSR